MKIKVQNIYLNLDLSKKFKNLSSHWDRIPGRCKLRSVVFEARSTSIVLFYIADSIKKCYLRMFHYCTFGVL